MKVFSVLPVMNYCIHVKLFTLPHDYEAICFVKEEEDFCVNLMIKPLYFNFEIYISICNICRDTLSVTVLSEDLQEEWRRLTPKLLYALVERWKLLSYLVLGQTEVIGS